MFGSLVVVLPTVHEGSQLVLRHSGKDWTVDLSHKFAAATEPSVCLVAFFIDIEHEVLHGHQVIVSRSLATFTINPSIPPPPFLLHSAFNSSKHLSIW
ncbi:hypothetical protein V8E55_006472 [Tylopilus felleus]